MTNIVLYGGNGKNPRVGGGVSGTSVVTKNPTQHSPSYGYFGNPLLVDAMIHHAQILSNHLKVSIDISIEDDALLPIPVDEDIITVGLDLTTFVAWPKHLIDGKVSADDYSATCPPPPPPPKTKYLYDNFVPKSKKKVMLISPQANILGAGMVPNDTWKKQKSQEVANILDKNKEIVDLFFAPLNTGALNTYRALNPKRQRPAKWIHVKRQLKISLFKAYQDKT
ncbi:hypothetical protein Lal_00030157 [Lupinus albus]|nr:hypothetical protein Lal_00030157 [Lupinus albus]